MPIALISPTTSLNKCMRNLGYLVAHTEKFKEMVGATTNAEAESRVHEFGVSDRLDPQTNEFVYPRPRAIIMPGTHTHRTQSPGGILRDGALGLSFECDVPPEYAADAETEDTQRIDEWFANTVETIIEQMHDLRMTPRNEVETYFCFEDIELEDGPCEMLDDQNGIFWAAVYRVNWFGL